ncbi:MAG: lipid-A-disaccharide synthase [Gammaproteobacteria bacterium]
MIRIGIVAGEASGDRLGAALIRALRERRSNIQVDGIAGPAMIAAGCTALYPLERLSVMGLKEVLGRYRELWSARRRLAGHFVAQGVQVFIGIDAPEFNLGLAHRLHRAGIKTVHFVSPQVWAWREWRVRGIARSVDRMLTLFPFEEEYYRRRGIAARCVGHPLADEITAPADRAVLRAQLGLPARQPLLALLPGSRHNEWRYHLQPFIDTVRWLRERRPDLGYVMAAVSDPARHRIEAHCRQIESYIPVRVARAREIICAADVVLTVSGTASLEAMLLGRPMVVVYRMGGLSYLVARSLVRVPFIALPNLLAGRRLVPELIQGAVRAEVIGPAVLQWLDDPAAAHRLELDLGRIAASLRRGASARAAEAVLELLGDEADPARG